ncbi:MAG TPA: adenylate/guanylate cyclase domain-containing protein [Verrucomicrobiaceae bacterium]|jgi:adenylate cyclase
METHLKALATGVINELQEFNLIGRGEEATIKIDDTGVSRQHATIRREGGHFWLVDLGSANGTYVNDTALTTARVLRDGDRIQFGTNLFLFSQDGGAPQESPEIGMTTQVLRRAPVKLVTRPVTFIVADLRGFTALSAQLSADQVADLLREWYADCNTIMRQRGAMIDKFIGDCVFAYWHGTEPDIRLKAVEAARALRDSEDSSTSPARLALKAQKDISLDCRVGLHVGDAAMGAMGKGINTAVGDAVNLAFRIESLTRTLDVGVLASAAFVVDWPEGRELFEPRGSHEVKGHPDKVEVFSLKES